MHKFLVVLLLVVFESQAASVRVTVAEPINGRSEADVQFAARVKAKDEGISKLPVMMVVHEQIKDEQYFEQVESLAAGGGLVKVVSEHFDSDGNLYEMTADVELDDALTLSLLGSIQRGQNAIRELADLRNKLAGEAKLKSENLQLKPSSWHKQLEALNITPEHFINNGRPDKTAQKKYAIELAGKVLASEMPTYQAMTRAQVVTDESAKREIDRALGPMVRTAQAKAKEEERLKELNQWGLMPWNNPNEISPVYAIVDVPGRYDLQVFSRLTGIIGKQTGASHSEIGYWIGASPCLAWYKSNPINKEFQLDYTANLVPRDLNKHALGVSAILSRDVIDSKTADSFGHSASENEADKPTRFYIRFDRRMDPKLFSEQVEIKLCYNNPEIYQAVLANRKSEGLSSKKP